MNIKNLNNLSDDQLKELAASLDALEYRKKYNQQEFLWDSYPKDKYKKIRQFFKAGAFYKERALIAANRSGKTRASMTEVSYHANGRYPKGWDGREFDRPVLIWCIGKTHDTTKEVLQEYLLGSKFEFGTGFLPKDDIYWDGKFQLVTKSGVGEGIEIVHVKHFTKGKFDGYSKICFKSYVQGVSAFMGQQVDIVAMDEEPVPASIYTECCIRTMTTNGIILCTFTPKLGLSEVVLSFLPGGKFPLGGIGPIEEEFK